MTTKHAALIKLWADGALIETRMPDHVHEGWTELDAPGGDSQPGWFDDFEYRVKPKPALSREANDLIATLCDTAMHWGRVDDRGSEPNASRAEDAYDEARAKLSSFLLQIEQKLLDTKSNI